MSRASHILGATGAMRRVHPNRLHSQGYHPAPGHRLTWWRRALRALVGSLT